MKNPIEMLIGANPQRNEIERGAYVLVNDPNCIFYRRCKKYAKKNKGVVRILSSHASSQKQYEVPISDGVILFGYLHTNTYFQMERYSLSQQPMCHCLTWLYYKVTGENVGPKGYSEHLETRNPIIIETF